MIRFDHVSKRFGERLALDDVTWRMEEGECLGLLGPNGAGKTTALRLVFHADQPTEGQVSVGTFPPGALSRKHRALLRRTLGIVYQDFRLLADRSVYENVGLALRITGRFPEESITPHVMHALEEVGLPHKARAFPAQLSAGEKQRAAIARAIVHRPAVILADEPTGNLEKRSGAEVLSLLRRLHAEGVALLLATSHEEVAAVLPGRTLRLEDGRLVGESGERSVTRAGVAPIRNPTLAPFEGIAAGTPAAPGGER